MCSRGCCRASASAAEHCRFNSAMLARCRVPCACAPHTLWRKKCPTVASARAWRKMLRVQRARAARACAHAPSRSRSRNCREVRAPFLSRSRSRSRSRPSSRSLHRCILLCLHCLGRDHDPITGIELPPQSVVVFFVTTIEIVLNKAKPAAHSALPR